MKLPQATVPSRWISLGVIAASLYVLSYSLVGQYDPGDGGVHGRRFPSRWSLEFFYPLVLTEQAIVDRLDTGHWGFIGLVDRNGSQTSLAMALPFCVPVGLAWHYARGGKLSIRSLLILIAIEAVSLAMCLPVAVYTP
jgi:hypothetical protein